MKKVAALLLFLGPLCFGQAVRVDQPLLTSGPNVPVSGGALAQTLWYSNATIYVCAHSALDVSLAWCQANPVTTYTDATKGTPCPSNAQLVQLPGTTCTNSSGITANVGLWADPSLSLIDYWVVSTYGSFGPFTVSPGGSGGCVGGGSIAQGCTAATTQPGAFTNIVGPGGTITGPTTLNNVTNATIAGGPFIDARSKGAVFDGGTDDTAALQSAGNLLLNGGTTLLSPTESGTKFTNLSFPLSTATNTFIFDFQGATWYCYATHDTCLKIYNQTATSNTMILMRNGIFRYFGGVPIASGSASGTTVTLTTSSPMAVPYVAGNAIAMGQFTGNLSNLNGQGAAASPNGAVTILASPAPTSTQFSFTSHAFDAASITNCNANDGSGYSAGTVATTSSNGRAVPPTLTITVGGGGNLTGVTAVATPGVGNAVNDILTVAGGTNGKVIVTQIDTSTGAVIAVAMYTTLTVSPSLTVIPVPGQPYSFSLFAGGCIALNGQTLNVSKAPWPTATAFSVLPPSNPTTGADTGTATPVTGSDAGFTGATNLVDINGGDPAGSFMDRVTVENMTFQSQFAFTTPFQSENTYQSMCLNSRAALPYRAGNSLLWGASFTPAQQTALITTLQGITNGSMAISFNGTPYTLSGMNFSGITGLPDAATIINTALTGVSAPGVAKAPTAGNGPRFSIANTVNTTDGNLNTVTFASSTGSGTDVSALLGLASISPGAYVIPGNPAPGMSVRGTNAWYLHQSGANSNTGDWTFNRCESYGGDSGVFVNNVNHVNFFAGTYLSSFRNGLNLQGISNLYATHVENSWTANNTFQALRAAVALLNGGTVNGLETAATTTIGTAGSQTGQYINGTVNVGVQAFTNANQTATISGGNDFEHSDYPSSSNSCTTPSYTQVCYGGTGSIVVTNPSLYISGRGTGYVTASGLACTSSNPGATCGTVNIVANTLGQITSVTLATGGSSNVVGDVWTITQAGASGGQCQVSNAPAGVATAIAQIVAPSVNLYTGTPNVVLSSLGTLNTTGSLQVNGATALLTDQRPTTFKYVQTGANPTTNAGYLGFTNGPDGVGEPAIYGLNSTGTNNWAPSALFPTTNGDWKMTTCTAMTTLESGVPTCGGTTKYILKAGSAPVANSFPRYTDTVGDVNPVTSTGSANVVLSTSPTVTTPTIVNSLIAGGTTSVSGCSLTGATGGQWAGSFASGTTGTCTVTITPGNTAPHGFVCTATDITAKTLVPQSATSTTTCTISGATTSADVVTWVAVAY